MFLFNLAAAKWYPVLFDSPLNATRAVFFWLTIAAVIGFIVCMVVLKDEKRVKAAKLFGMGAVIYACLVAATLLILSFMDDGIVAILFVPILITLLAIACAFVLMSVMPGKITSIVSAVAVGAAVIATLVCMGIHFANGGSLELNWIEDASTVNTIALYVFAVLAIVAVVALAYVFDKKEKLVFDARSLSFAAICIAMSFALSYLRVVKMPQGGSITIASLLPIMLYSYMFGTRKGVFAGMIYGILQAFQDMYILHPAQFILDYPAAFACIGLAGLFANKDMLPQVKFALGAVVAGIARFVMHFLSGVFAFAAFAPEGTPAWLYSLGYQAGYVLPDIAIVVVVGVLLFSSTSFVSTVKRYSEAE